MSKTTYYIDDGSFWGHNYDREDIEAIHKSLWNDSVGKHFTKEANSAINSFNMEHEGVWKKMESLLNVKEDEITYTSKEYEINALWID